MKRLQVYSAPGITVTFDPNVCIHSAVCVANLPAVFDTRRARWIHADAATAERVAQTIDRCPSGALQYYRNVEGDPAAKQRLNDAIAENRTALERAAKSGREDSGER